MCFTQIPSSLMLPCSGCCPYWKWMALACTELPYPRGHPFQGHPEPNGCMMQGTVQFGTTVKGHPDPELPT